MADLKRTHRWERYAPDIGDNREQPDGQRLELEVASSLTHEQFAGFESALRACLDEAKADTGSLTERLAAVFAPYVRLVGVHTIDGKPVTNLAEYVAVVSTLCGVYNLKELTQAVRDFNSSEGTSELFSVRHSGGLRTTRGQSVAPATGVH
jgi:hypothetical protein